MVRATTPTKSSPSRGFHNNGSNGNGSSSHGKMGPQIWAVLVLVAVTCVGLLMNTTVRLPQGGCTTTQPYHHHHPQTDSITAKDYHHYSDTVPAIPVPSPPIPPPPPPIPPPPTKRWAVMMIGGARTYAACRPSFFKHVLNQQQYPPALTAASSSSSLSLPQSSLSLSIQQRPSVDATTRQIDVFTYAGLSPDRGCQIDTLGVHLLTMDSTVMHVDRYFAPEPIQTSNAASYDRFVRQQTEHWRIMEDYAAARNITYDYVLYTRPDMLYIAELNLTALEKLLDQRPNEWWSPSCCAFRGLCDRIGAASWQNWRHMMRSSTDWYQVAQQRVGEKAFLDRARFAGLNATFDLDADPSAGPYFDFATVRYFNLQTYCSALQGRDAFTNTWVDHVCNHANRQLAQYLDLDDASCYMLNNSVGSCPGEARNFRAIPTANATATTGNGR